MFLIVNKTKTELKNIYFWNLSDTHAMRKVEKLIKSWYFIELFDTNGNFLGYLERTKSFKNILRNVEENNTEPTLDQETFVSKLWLKRKYKISEEERLKRKNNMTNRVKERRKNLNNKTK